MGHLWFSPVKNLILELFCSDPTPCAACPPLGSLYQPLQDHKNTRAQPLTPERTDWKRTHPLRTTMKSMTFQPLRRYEPLWKMNPRATILIPASKQKIPMKYGSVFSCGMRSMGAGKGGSECRQSHAPAALSTLTTPRSYRTPEYKWEVSALTEGLVKDS